ncbi:MAG: DUF6531 domain-containing protein [Pseudomonadota bacterium]
MKIHTNSKIKSAISLFLFLAFFIFDVSVYAEDCKSCDNVTSTPEYYNACINLPQNIEATCSVLGLRDVFCVFLVKAKICGVDFSTGKKSCVDFADQTFGVTPTIIPCPAGCSPPEVKVGDSCLLPLLEETTCPTDTPTFPGTGVKLHQETDVAGAGAEPLHFTRYYRSRWPDDVPSAFMPLGAGWTHTYDRSIYVITGAPKPQVRALRGDGSWRSFVRDDTQSTATSIVWRDISPGNTQDRLTQQLDAQGQTLRWVYRSYDDGSVESYSAEGRLKTIKARNGHVTTLVYSSASTPLSRAPYAGLLLAVRNAFGRELRLSYDSAGRLNKLVPPSGELLRYDYDARGNLAAFSRPSADAASRATKRYHYEDDRGPNTHALTGITDEQGVRITTYTYDAQGRVASTEKAQGVEKLSFQYASSTGVSSTSSTIFYTPFPGAASTPTQYAFSVLDGVLRPTSVTTPCPLCGASAATTDYDANQRKSKVVAHDGRVTFYSYDAKGRITREATYPASYQSATTAPPLAAAENVTRTQWHATWDLPLRVAEAYLITSYSHDSKGNLLELIDTPTTDATGAEGFNATPSGTTYTTRWTYDAKNLPTTIVELEGSTETGRWELAYNAMGDLTGITHATTGTVATLVPQGDGSSLITEIIGELDESPAGVSIASSSAPRMVGIAAKGRGPVDKQPAQNGGESRKGDNKTACTNPFDAAINVIRPDYCKNKQKKKEKCDPVIYPRNPGNHPEDFHDQKYSGKAWKNKYDGSMWETDNSQHGGSTWKRWKNQKTWEKFSGKYESVRDNGTVR